MSGHLDDRRLFEALDGQGTAHERAHLAACTSCQRALAQKQAAMQALHLAAARPLGSLHLRQLGDRLLGALPAQVSPPSHVRWWLGLATAATAGASLALLAQLTLHKLAAPADRSAAPALVQHLPEPSPAPSLSGLPVSARTSLDSAPPPLPTEPLSASAHAAIPSPNSAPRTPPALRSTKDLAHDFEELTKLDNPAAEPPDPSDLAIERPATDELEQHLAQLESAPGDHPLELLQTLPTLLRVAARQLQPQQLELIAQRIANLALDEPGDEMASFLGCETALLARRYPAAMDLCQAYLRRFPQGPRARDVAFLAASTARLQLADCTRAVPLYDQALTFSGVLQSYNDEAYLGRALCHRQLGDLAGARSDLNLFLFKYPERRRDREVRSLIEQLQLSP